VWHVGVKAKFRHAKGPKKRDPLGADVVERSFSLEDLERASEQLASVLASMSHNDLIYSWGISERKNALVVVAAEDHAEAARSLVQSVLPDPELVEISFAKERPTASMRGGEQIASATAVCSIGFNALRGSQRGFVTAGHCFIAGNVLTSAQAPEVPRSTSLRSLPQRRQTVWMERGPGLIPARGRIQQKSTYLPVRQVR
jgi:hypothetical protein